MEDDVSGGDSGDLQRTHAEIREIWRGSDHDELRSHAPFEKGAAPIEGSAGRIASRAGVGAAERQQDDELELIFLEDLEPVATKASWM